MDEQERWLDDDAQLIQMLAQSDVLEEKQAIQFLLGLRKDDQSFAKNPDKIYRSQKHLSTTMKEVG